MTTNADEQIRADFEAWLLTLGLHLGNHERQLMRIAYQAGRAALQSQDREDAMRWRYWRRWWANSEDETEQLPTMVTAVWRENPDYELDEAFDHAIRTEGEGK